VPLIGQGFQDIMDSYFWYLPFVSVRQCKLKYVMDNAKTPEDEWRTKREDLAVNTRRLAHASPSGLDSMLGWRLISTNSAEESVLLCRSTKTIVVEDDA
jgi:hypothetical protein